MKHSDINWAAMIDLGKKLVGKPYVFGSEVKLSDPDPQHIKSIDCSELVEFLFANLQRIDGTRAGLAMPDGSYNQARMCRRLKFTPNDPKSDVLLIGDLGFKWDPETEAIHHVGIFIGNGQVLEAKGKSWGTILAPFDIYTQSRHFAFWARHKSIEDA
jgi:cell wall-associated NlpC family hydrolase